MPDPYQASPARVLRREDERVAGGRQRLQAVECHDLPREDRQAVVVHQELS